MLDFDAHDAYRRYQAGETFGQIAHSYGWKKGDTVKVRMLKAGILLGNCRHAPNRLTIDADNILQLYDAGWSVKKLAEHFGCDRNVITQRLKESGIVPRNRSESMFLRMQQTSPEERQRLTVAAHDAVRGRQRGFAEKRQRALTRENIAYASPLEMQLIERFHQLGVEVVAQKAVGIYNIDIALAADPVAVEVFGGHWHASGGHAARFRERTDYLIDTGWVPVIVWVTNQRPLGLGAAQYCVTLAEKLRHNEPVRRGEHVIGGDGKPCAVGKSHLNYWT